MQHCKSLISFSTGHRVVIRLLEYARGANKVTAVSYTPLVQHLVTEQRFDLMITLLNKMLEGGILPDDGLLGTVFSGLRRAGRWDLFDDITSAALKSQIDLGPFAVVELMASANVRNNPDRALEHLSKWLATKGMPHRLMLKQWIRAHVQKGGHVGVIQYLEEVGLKHAVLLRGYARVADKHKKQRTGPVQVAAASFPQSSAAAQVAGATLAGASAHDFFEVNFHTWLDLVGSTIVFFFTRHMYEAGCRLFRSFYELGFDQLGNGVIDRVVACVLDPRHRKDPALRADALACLSCDWGPRPSKARVQSAMAFHLRHWSPTGYLLALRKLVVISPEMQVMTARVHALIKGLECALRNPSNDLFMTPQSVALCTSIVPQQSVPWPVTLLLMRLSCRPGASFSVTQMINKYPSWFCFTGQATLCWLFKGLLLEHNLKAAIPLKKLRISVPVRLRILFYTAPALIRNRRELMDLIDVLISLSERDALEYRLDLCRGIMNNLPEAAKLYPLYSSLPEIVKQAWVTRRRSDMVDLMDRCIADAELTLRPRDGATVASGTSSDLAEPLPVLDSNLEEPSQPAQHRTIV